MRLLDELDKRAGGSESRHVVVVLALTDRGARRPGAADAAAGVAPVLFGWLSDTLAGNGHAGLREAFLVSIAPLIAATAVGTAECRAARRFSL